MPEDLDQRIRSAIQEDLRLKTILTHILIEQEGSSLPGWTAGQIEGMTGGDLASLLRHGIVEKFEGKYTGTDTRGTLFRLICTCKEMEEILSGIYLDPEVQKAAKHEMVPAEAVAGFEDLLCSGVDMVDFLASKINPKVEGLLHVKRGILLCLASSPDIAGDRGRIHVLMQGNPGTAKSMLRMWVSNQLGAGSCSQRTTKVGLMGSAGGGEIVPGALPRNDKGVLTIDELDKFPRDDRQGLLEAMEEGVIEVEAGGKSKRFPAEVRIIACANRIRDFSPELQDRFDFKFLLETPTGDEEKRVVSTIVRSWFRDKPWYDGKQLKMYLTWISDYQPPISDEVRKVAEAMLLRWIELEPGQIGEVRDLAPRGIRARESVLRVAYTIARLNRRGLIWQDIIRAVRILEPNVEQATLAELERVACEKEVQA